MNIPQSNIANMLSSISSLNHVLNETLTVYASTTTNCPNCGYDPIRKESTDPSCPTCGGKGLIETLTSTSIPCSIETQEDFQYSYAEVGRLLDGEILVTIDNLEISTVLNTNGKYSMDKQSDIKAFLDQYDYFEWKGGKYVVKSFQANYLQGTFYELSIILKLM
ncbi:MAG TPA: hypothetical protein VKU94_03855 [Geobacterales bacterium]|nr:hypothetical protein [Geobacterales bacterium]